MQTALEETTKTASNNQVLQTMNTPSDSQHSVQGKSTIEQEESLLKNLQESARLQKAEAEFQNNSTSDSNDRSVNGLNSDMTNSNMSETMQDESKQLKMDDLVAALREADASGTPENIQLEPSIETVVREAGPEVLGHSIDDVSRTLHSLSKQADENLSPERIAAMTAQDAPQMLTPVARSLHAVLRSTGVLRQKLASIAEASNALLSRAEARGDERLKLAEATVHKADKEDEEIADQENCPNIGGELNNVGAPNQDTQLAATQDPDQLVQMKNQMMPLLMPPWPVRRADVRTKPHDTLRWFGQQHAQLQRFQRQVAADFL